MSNNPEERSSHLFRSGSLKITHKKKNTVGRFCQVSGRRLASRTSQIRTTSTRCTRSTKHLEATFRSFLGKFAKFRKATISFVRSVRPSAWRTRFPLDGFSWNLIWVFFRKSVEKTQVSIKDDKNNWVLYMKNNIHFLPLLANFLEWKMFQTKVVQTTNIHILCSIIIFSKNVPFMR